MKFYQKLLSSILISAGFLSASLFLVSEVTKVQTASLQQDPPYTIFFPFLQGISQPTPLSTSPVGDRIWDPRLDQRDAFLIPAQVSPEEGYWRLIEAVWFDEQESGGRHHIFVDTLDVEGNRQADVPILISWPEGTTRIDTQTKPGEEYAADFGMFSVAPAYRAHPNNGAPADSVEGMGMGSIEQPAFAIHTSYGLIWQWTIAGGATDTPTATATATATSTSTPTATSTATLTSTGTITPSVTVTPVVTVTPTHTLTPTATVTVTPTSTRTPEPTTSPYLFSQAELASCTTLPSGTRLEGTVYLNDEPADGYRVVFSFQFEGQWASNPAISGPQPPGFYSHIVNTPPEGGTWYTWIVAADSNKRISEIAKFETDGPEGSCHLAIVNFYGP